MLLPLVLLVHINGYASWTVTVDGLVTGEENERLEEASVSLSKNFSRISEVTTGSTGKFIFILQPDNDYQIEATKDGYVTKKIMFSTRNVSAQVAKKGFAAFLVELNLFKKRKGLLNTTILNKPVGKITYSEKERDFAIDKEYAGMIKDQLNKLNRELEALRKKESEMKIARQQKFEKDLKDGKVYSAVHRNAVTRKPNTGSSSAKSITASGPGAEKLTVNTHVRSKPIKVVSTKHSSESAALHHFSAYDSEPSLPGEEIIEGGNKTIIKRVIFKNGQVFEYRKVQHKWGATYYFRNNIPITEFIFDSETARD
ncbi:MAG: carboxypeptidase regulatory-like domain-containing protein [Bacteroidetes bacterium]|nr:carboxypeptidase regulatory-like domain-containing protein [Bacteroidota bacterium]